MILTAPKTATIRILKVAGLGVVALGASAIFVTTRLELHQVFQKVLARQGKDIVYDAFDSTLDRVTAQLGEPVKADNFRESEMLIYWDYNPVMLQIHFYHGRVLRMAYFASDTLRRDDLVNEIIAEFGGETAWRRGVAEIDGEKKYLMIQQRKHLTLVTEEQSVMVYGYILR